MSIDSFPYYGTDDTYLNYVARFVRPSGILAIAGAGLMHELDGAVPEHLERWWEPAMWCLHSAEWWRRHWERTGLVTIECADTMPDGWQAWLEWQRAVAPHNSIEIDAMEADRGRSMGYVRVVAKRRRARELPEVIVSVPMRYTQYPLLREGHPKET